jgi:hypothetical protein
VKFPSSLKKLHFGTRFNQSLVGVALAQVEQITFSAYYAQPLDDVYFPASLKRLYFNKGIHAANNTLIRVPNGCTVYRNNN